MILEIILIAILLIILIFLYVGIDLIGDFQKKESELTFNLQILIFSKVKVYSISYPSEKKDDDSKKEKKERNINFKLIKPCIKPILGFLKDLIKSMNVRKLESHLDFGLPSYVSTAKYTGYMWALLVFPNTVLDNTCLTVTPCFDKTVIDFKGSIDVRIKLLKIIIPLFKLILNKNIRKLIKEVR